MTLTTRKRENAAMSATETVRRLAHNRWAGPLLLLAALTLDAATAGGVRQPAATATAALMALPFALRRTRPVVSVLGVAAALVANVLLGVSLENWSTPLLALFWAIFTVFARLTGQQRWAALAVLLTSLVTSVVFDGGTLQRRLAPGDLFFLVALLGPAVFTGIFAQVRQRYAEALEARSQALEREREAQLAAALSEDRLRIARDMHDVVAHTVSLMSLNVGAVRRLLDDDQPRLREILMQVEDAGRSAIDELKQVLDVLRGGSAPETGPQTARIADLEMLITTAQSAGQQVEVLMEGDPSIVPAEPARIAYRVVQEALTNARRHAAGCPVTLRMVCGRDDVRIEVVNEIRSGSASWTDQGGHGLVGMRERVTSCGGVLDAGSVEDGRFRVSARIPYGTRVLT